MGKVVVAAFISLDGYIEAPNREMVPPAPSPDLFRYFIERNLTRAGVFVYGRVSYEGMVRYWTSPDADAKEAARLAASRKVVFSTTLAGADWGQVEIARGDPAAVVKRLKTETDKDIVILGGAGVANSFMRAGLVEEYFVLVTPMLFGGGTPLFAPGLPRTQLRLLEARPFDLGSVLLTYAPA
ncbi:MAG TPA: dihydrofolate reductase family protein [Bauldia sp.]|nr:dihydrofolate reductase family protein [Bauldia sp.]